MLPYFNECFGNPHSTDHSYGWKSALAVENATKQIANLIGAFADEIFFTSGATESNNLALIGLARRVAPNNKRTRFILSEIEHKCVLETGRVISHNLSLPVEILRVDHQGKVCLKKLGKMLEKDVLVVSIMAVNNEIGTIQDIEQISEIVRNSGALFHCDAAQAPISMELKKIAEHVDLLSLSAHKMYGPKGIGILYVRQDLVGRIEPLIYGGGQQEGLRPGTIPTHLCVGMGAAAEFLNRTEVQNKRRILLKRRDEFVGRIKKLPWPIKLNGAEGNHRHPGNANLCFQGFSADDILQRLQPIIAASTGSACTTGIPEPSYVLRAIGLSYEESEASIRFSLGFDTTDEDIEIAVDLIDKTLFQISKFNQ